MFLKWSFFLFLLANSHSVLHISSSLFKRLKANHRGNAWNVFDIGKSQAGCVQAIFKQAPGWRTWMKSLANTVMPLKKKRALFYLQKHSWPPGIDVWRHVSHRMAQILFFHLDLKDATWQCLDRQVLLIGRYGYMNYYWYKVVIHVILYKQSS